MTISPSPSARQLARYKERPHHPPVVLFYEYSCKSTSAAAGLAQRLAKLARTHDGQLRWTGAQQQVLIGRVDAYQYCCCLHFLSRGAALEHVEDPQHAELLRGVKSLQVAVISEQPRVSRLVIGLMGRLLPWVPFNNAAEDTPEPGMGTTVMPTENAMEAFIGHREQQTPIVMINWLRFRKEARYADPQAPRISGKAAYYLYGKVAFKVLHSLGAKALFISRYQQILIGNGGDPGTDLWDEFALVQYPGRATFKRMASLKRYRAALHHRQAGLAEHGQGLVVAVSRRL
ncbi:MAG TPA: hypothetical protein VGE51_14785 [Fontimonas sp.]